MTRPIIVRDFDNPCPSCKGTLFNQSSGKCVSCIRKARLNAVLAKCAGQPQRRDADSYLDSTSKRAKQFKNELRYMGHPKMNPIVTYENEPRITL